MAIETVTGNVVEGQDLESCEAVIENGLSAFVEVGQALADIKANEYWRDAAGTDGIGYETFEAYCAGRWGFARSNAYRQIRAANADAIVREAGLPAIPSEGVARVLTGAMNEAGLMDSATGTLAKPELGKAKLIDVWTAAVNAHENPAKSITAREVQAILTGETGSGSGGHNSFEMFGTVGDKLNAVRKAFDKADKALTRKPSAKLRDQVERYATWADDIAGELRRVASEDWRRPEDEPEADADVDAEADSEDDAEAVTA